MQDERVSTCNIRVRSQEHGLSEGFAPAGGEKSRKDAGLINSFKNCPQNI